jgi:hypothetical protein
LRLPNNSLESKKILSDCGNIQDAVELKAHVRVTGVTRSGSMIQKSYWNFGDLSKHIRNSAIDEFAEHDLYDDSRPSSESGKHHVAVSPVCQAQPTSAGSVASSLKFAFRRESF